MPIIRGRSILLVAVSIRGWNRSKSNNMMEQIVHSMCRGWNRVELRVLMEKEARMYALDMLCREVGC